MDARVTRRRRARPLALVLAAAVLAAARPAAARPAAAHPAAAHPAARAAGAHPEGATPDPHRRIAVLEFRGGSAALPRVTGAVARLLRARTSLAVVTGAELRARHPDLDRRVSSCAGGSACVARIARDLDVDEVLLVGVAEFGDIILTLQRVDTRGQVLARLAQAEAPGTRPDDHALLGYLRQVMAAGDFRRYGVLRIATDLTGATVQVGGQARGLTPLSPLRVPAPATYDIVVEKPGYMDFRASVAVPPDAEVKVNAELSRRGGERPWYARWWVISIAGAVAVGAVATAVVVSRGGSDNVPVKVEPF